MYEVYFVLDGLLFYECCCIEGSCVYIFFLWVYWGYVFVIDEDGMMIVFDVNKNFEVIGMNVFDDDDFCLVIFVMVGD